MKRKPNFPNFPPIAGVSEQDYLLSPRDAAQLLGVAVGTLRRWRYEHRGPPFIKVEGSFRYSLKALRAYLAARTKVRTSAPFYRRTKIEELGEKHPGLRRFVEERQRRRESWRVIAAEVFERWGETVSAQVLSNFYRLRVFPKEST